MLISHHKAVAPFTALVFKGGRKKGDKSFQIAFYLFNIKTDMMTLFCTGLITVYKRGET